MRPAIARSPLPRKAHGLAALLLLAAALSARGAGSGTATLRDESAQLVLRLHFDSLVPGTKQLEYSGDYHARKAPFRIFAQERYLVQAGGFRGWGEDHYLEKTTTEDQPGFPHLEEQSFSARLINGSGDTLELESGAMTSAWKDGMEVYRRLRRKDGSRMDGSLSLVALAEWDRVFPALPEPTSIRQAAERRLIVSGQGLEPVVPPYASRVEVFNLSGERLHAGKVEPGSPLRIAPRVREEGILYIRFE